MEIHQYNFYCPKWVEPNNRFTSHEFEFEFDSSIPDKIKNILKPNDEIAHEIEKIPTPDDLLEKLKTDAELKVKKYHFPIIDQK